MTPENIIDIIKDLLRRLEVMERVGGQSLIDSGWISPTLQNSWVDYGSPYTSGQYRKIGKIVYLKGLLKNGTVGSDDNTNVIFQLPSNYRPQADMLISLASNGAFGNIKITASDGKIHAQVGSNTSFSLDGISFIADL